MQEILTCEEKKKKESSLLNQNKPHSPFTILKRSLIIPTRTYFGSMLLKKKKKKRTHPVEKCYLHTKNQ